MTSVPVTPTLAENTVNMFRKDRLERYSLSASDAPLNVVRNDRAGMAGKQFVWILQDVQSKVLWSTLAAHFSNNLFMQPVIFCGTVEDAKYYARAVPTEVAVTIIAMDDFHSHIVAGGDQSVTDTYLETEIAAREKQHDMAVMRTMVLNDRHLGRDLTTGARGFPRSKTSERRSMRTMLEACLVVFRFWEKVWVQFPPELIVTLVGGAGIQWRPVVFMARKNNVPFRNMVFTRFGHRFYWADDEYGFSSRFAVHMETVPAATDADIEAASKAAGIQVLTTPTDVAILKRSQSWLQIFRRIPPRVARHVYGYIRGYAKVLRGYLLWSNIAFTFRGRLHRNWLDRNAERSLKGLRGRRFVYHALQVEPEMTTTLLGEYASDQLALTAQIALELPADTVLLVKEHPWAVGFRDLDFYRKIQSSPKMILVHPDYPSIDLIRQSAAVSTSSSSVAFEAAAIGVPAFHTIVRSLLDVVPHAISLLDTRNLAHVRKLIDQSDDESLRRRKLDGARWFRAIDTFGFKVNWTGQLQRSTPPDEQSLAAMIKDLKMSLGSTHAFPSAGAGSGRKMAK